MRETAFRLWALAVVFLAGCYNPQIADGGLHCSAAFECPSGFTCRQSDGVCWKQGTIPPIGGMGGSSGVGGGGTSGTGMGGTGNTGGGGSGMVCTTPSGQYGPFPMCMPPVGATGCDPVCQSGCACNERCKLEAGNPACRPEGPVFLQQFDSCVPSDDKCRPGTICLQEQMDNPACGNHCYRHCRENTDCPNGSKCSVDVNFGNASSPNKVCSPPADGCNPFGPARCVRSDRPYPTFGCYLLSSSFPDVAICDCAGTKKPGEPCMFEHECEPGSECVSAGTRVCRRVCKVGVMGLPVVGGCPATMTCTPFPQGMTYGYCH
jgi:hypothetical protein